MDRVIPCAMNFYRDSKAIATQKAIHFAQSQHLNVTILEPVWVYGEREFNTGFYQYLKTVKTGLPYFPGHSNNKFPVIYCQDLARAYYLAYYKKLKGVHRFIIGNQDTIKMSSFLYQFCKASKFKPPKNLPLWMVYPIAFIVELMSIIFHLNKPPTLTRGRAKMYYDNLNFSSAKAWNILSFRNKYSITEGIQRTVRWYKINHLI